MLRLKLRAVPQAEAAAVEERHVLGEGLDALSEGQLELLEHFHDRQLARVRELLRQAEVTRLVQIAMQKQE